MFNNFFYKMKILKRATMAALLAVFLQQGAMAIPADPRPKTVRQPDGTTITVLMRGDEHRHVLLSEDGFPLIYDTQKKQFEYARLTNNRLVASGICAANPGERNAQAKAYVASANRQQMLKAAATMPLSRPMMRRAVTEPSGYTHPMINNFPTTGHMKTLCLLIQFSDVKFSSIDNPQQFYNNLLNTKGFTYSNGANGSARDFYNDASTGVFDPQWDVIGPITLSKGATYYGTDTPSQDAHMGEAVKEAVEKAHDMGVDFSQYDYDNDGVVDNIAIIYAGYGEADDPNGKEFIWPHAANMEDDWGISMTEDGKKIGHYFCSNEVRYNADASVKEPTGIGTVVHEFGHILGLPDLYDVSYNMLSSMLQYGLYYWDTMAAGCYNNNMNTPATFSSYERFVLGWLKPEDVTADIDSIATLPNLAASNKALRVKVPGSDSEYFLLENRQQTGWDKYIYDHGMLAWHIDEVDSLWQKNLINIDQTHQHVDLVEVTGSQDNNPKNDALPGTNGVTSLALTAWNGSTVPAIDNVAEQNDTIRVLFSPSKFKLAAPENVKASVLTDSTLTWTWAPVADASDYLIHTYLLKDDGTKVQADTTVLSANKPTVWQLPSVEPDTEYGIDVTARRGSYASATTTATARTQVLPFAKRRPSGLTVSDVSASGFTAQWDALSDADSYELTLSSLAYGSNLVSKGYDFSGRSQGMPQQWATNSDSYFAVKGYYGNASPSLRLAADSAYLKVAYDESTIDSISFWCRSSREGNTIEVKTLHDGQWSTVATEPIGTTSQTLSIATDGAEAVSLVLHRASGYVVIDDVVARCHTLERTPVAGHDKQNVGQVLSYAYAHLPQGSYVLTLRGVQGGQYSLATPEASIVLSAATSIHKLENATESTPVIYQLNGMRVTGSQLSRGIYIVKEQGKVHKITVR